jgi:hypothetical protein
VSDKGILHSAQTGIEDEERGAESRARRSVGRGCGCGGWLVIVVKNFSSTLDFSSVTRNTISEFPVRLDDLVVA